MNPRLRCPRCNCSALDLLSYESMIVVSAKRALFSIRCPECGALVSSLQDIPAELREEVTYAAIEVGAGMGLEA